MLKKSSHEAVSLECRQTFLMNNTVQHIGWMASQKIAKAKHPSSWRVVTVIAAAFFIIMAASFGVNVLIDRLEWQARQNDSWWAKGWQLPIKANAGQFSQEKFNIFPNYLDKPLTFKNIFSGLIKSVFVPKSALAAVAETQIPWRAELVSLSNSKIDTKEGGALTVEAKYKNTGTNTWKNRGYGFVSLNVSNPYYHLSEFEHEYWHSYDQPALLLEPEIDPGEIGTFRFALQAPDNTGIYQEYFILSAENLAWFKGSEIDISFNVRSSLSDKIKTPDFSENDTSLEERIVNGEFDSLNQKSEATSTAALTEESNIEASLKISEPLIRVGLYKTVEPVIITASNDYEIKNTKGDVLQVLKAGNRSVISFDSYSKQFLVSAAGGTIVLPWAIFSASATSTVFTIVNYENHPKWNLSLNDNKYKGALEVRYGEKSASPWVINELYLEDYIKGVKETSQISPSEYQKAIAVAARTYALWQLNDGNKHKGNNFTVDAVWDQVYRGYSTEIQVPAFSEAVEDTEGIVVTYNNEIALTPYFAQSDGRTRSYQEVWFGGKKPWLVSVLDPTNAGLKKWGHGVGMSARGALIMASRQNKTYDQILKYYYTGVSLERYYKSGVIITEDINNRD